MELEVLVSTMGIKTSKENQKLIKMMKVTGKSLTVSQCGKKAKIPGKNSLICSNELGLSKSRNLALCNSESDIVLLADDDVIYEENYEDIIKGAYEKNPNADIIAFYVESRNRNRKIRKLRSGRIGWIRIFRVNSVQLTFKRKELEKYKLKFDENFGAGTKNFCGEETILLSDCLRNKMKLIYIDEKIGEVVQAGSSWYKGFSKELIQVEKECFKRIAPKLWWLLWIQFIVRKWKKFT